MDLTCLLSGVVLNPVYLTRIKASFLLKASFLDGKESAHWVRSFRVSRVCGSEFRYPCSSVQVNLSTSGTFCLCFLMMEGDESQGCEGQRPGVAGYSLAPENL
jgi:hypothetical protein